MWWQVHVGGRVISKRLAALGSRALTSIVIDQHDEAQTLIAPPVYHGGHVPSAGDMRPVAFPCSDVLSLVIASVVS